MIAVDTNILVRIVTNDQPEQARRAANVLLYQSIFISKTVVLELEWVLRHSYKLERQVIFNVVQKILATDNFTIEQHSSIEQALLWYKQGMDFADALHLAGSSHTDTFVSFDKKMLKKALSLNTGIHVIEP